MGRTFLPLDPVTPNGIKPQSAAYSFQARGSAREGKEAARYESTQRYEARAPGLAVITLTRTASVAT